MATRDGAEGKGRIVITHVGLFYRRHPVDKNEPKMADVVSMKDTIYHKSYKIVDEEGSTLDSGILERTNWETNEIEYLIVVRSSAGGLFKQALEDKYTIAKLWELVAAELPNDTETKKSGKQCQWMWNMLMKEYIDVLSETKPEGEFPFFEEMEQAWQLLKRAVR